jgi:magnesium-transporting ATPase (P-type)
MSLFLSSNIHYLTHFLDHAILYSCLHNIFFQVHKDAKAPFFMSGCKVADGSGHMLVTTVGTNTEWGMLMASISEDTGEETPLQVRCLS